MSQPTHAGPAEILSRLPLFSDCPADDLARLTAHSSALEIPKDGLIFMQGDACTHIWLVQSGRVKIVRQDGHGRETIIELIEPGEAFGGGVLFFPNQPATARAAEASIAISVPAEAYADFIATHPKTALKLIRMLGHRHFTMLQMHALAGERVERRMAHIMLKLVDRCGVPHSEGTILSIALSRQDLADMAGTTLETAIRTISRFANDGLVRTERGGYLIILDRPRLMLVAQSE